MVKIGVPTSKGWWRVNNITQVRFSARCLTVVDYLINNNCTETFSHLDIYFVFLGAFVICMSIPPLTTECVALCQWKLGFGLQVLVHVFLLLAGICPDSVCKKLISPCPETPERPRVVLWRAGFIGVLVLLLSRCSLSWAHRNDFHLLSPVPAFLPVGGEQCLPPLPSPPLPFHLEMQWDFLSLVSLHWSKLV